MPEAQRAPGGDVPESLIQGVRGWLHDGVQLLRVRLELLSLEARDQALAVIELLWLGLAAVLLGCLGLAFLAGLVTVLMWDSHRTLALALLAAAFITLAAVAAFMARDRWRASQRWFEASVQELQQDEQRLKP
jgi:uncharacterized membrane protein YqjE